MPELHPRTVVCDTANWGPDTPCAAPSGGSKIIRNRPVQAGNRRIQGVPFPACLRCPERRSGRMKGEREMIRNIGHGVLEVARAIDTGHAIRHGLPPKTYRHGGPTALPAGPVVHEAQAHEEPTMAP